MVSVTKGEKSKQYSRYADYDTVFHAIDNIKTSDVLLIRFSFVRHPYFVTSESRPLTQG